MSDIKKLTAIRDKIIDTFITKTTVQKTKNHHSFKNGFLRSFFKFLFLKPFKSKEILTAEDWFFYDKCGVNNVKGYFYISIITTAIILITPHKDEILLKSVLLAINVPPIAFFLCAKIRWNTLRDQINEKFDPENIGEIKRNLFVYYNARDINLLLGESLSKKDLNGILSKINEVVDEEELLNKFEKLETKLSNDITLPYNLISTINKVIEDLKKKEK